MQRIGRFEVERAIRGDALLVVMRGTITANRLALRKGAAMLRPASAPVDASRDAEVLSVSVKPTRLVIEPISRAWALNLIEEIERRDAAWEMVAEGLILEGLGRMERLDRLREQRPAWVDRALQMARRQESLRRIADAVGRHPSHVAREFRRHEGVSVGEFARRCRLELAARSLRSGEASIADVAFAAGFCDQSHFTNAFHRVFGVTPAVYRRKR